MRIHFQTLGCRLNEAETETWRRDFLDLGYHDAHHPEEADIIVVNSCAVTEEAVRKSRKLARRARRANPAAKLVLSGCYASLDAERAAAELGVDLLVGNPDKHRLPRLVQKAFAATRPASTAIDPAPAPRLPQGRQRAFIKVQDGCRYRCTFCIVTLARGEERSRALDEITAEIRQLYAEGVREVVLTGVHLGGYGAGLGYCLYDLLDAILKQTPMPRIRMGSLEPWDIPKGFWSLFENSRLMPHLHLPLQSGCDRTLRRMARRCKTADFRDLMEIARKRVPDINITTDIIVGFPGESEADWRESLDFIARMHFGHVHIFSYSPREGTKAASLPDPVPREIKRQRSETLHALAQRMQRETLEARQGTTAPILIEAAPLHGSEHHYAVSGYTPNFLRVAIDGLGAEAANQIIDVKLRASGDHQDRFLVGHPTAGPDPATAHAAPVIHPPRS